MDMRAIIRHRLPSGELSWLRFEHPAVEYVVHKPSEVLSALAEVESAVRKNRWYAAGYVAYEAAPGFDASLAVRSGVPLPLLHFGLFSSCVMSEEWPATETALPGKPGAGSLWSPTLTESDFCSKLTRARKYLFDGDTYQVNFTFRLRSEWAADNILTFARFCEAQPTEYAAFIDTGRHVLISASPELFYRADGGLLTCRPMKGTAARGATPEDDMARRQELERSEKNRAENIMIVDMIRNDLGKIAVPGSVEVSRLCEVEAHPTVWQMTSTVTARSAATTVECFRALFPCASITGAPKRRTMEIIAALESESRGVYTGAIGVMKPDGDACFSVAIRTMHVDRERATAEYGVGSGVVWDSDDVEEYRECHMKARVLRRAAGDGSLLETILWTPARGYVWLDQHLGRMRRSAAVFGFSMDEEGVRRTLREAVARGGLCPLRVRLVLGADGVARAQSEAAPAMLARPMRVALAVAPVRRSDIRLRHKTTCRGVYDDARRCANDVDDVILWNEEGELTESTIANIVIRLDGQWVTPPQDCGLLAGIHRGVLLRRGCVRERVIRRGDLDRAECLCLVNSVRGIMRAERVG